MRTVGCDDEEGEGSDVDAIEDAEDGRLDAAGVVDIGDTLNELSAVIAARLFSSAELSAAADGCCSADDAAYD